MLFKRFLVLTGDRFAVVVLVDSFLRLKKPFCLKPHLNGVRASVGVCTGARNVADLCRFLAVVVSARGLDGLRLPLFCWLVNATCYCTYSAEVCNESVGWFAIDLYPVPSPRGAFGGLSPPQISKPHQIGI